MPEFLANISALWVFLSIAALGFIFLLVSLLFGERYHGALLLLRVSRAPGADAHAACAFVAASLA